MIRRLERADYPQVFELLKKFASESGVKDLVREDYDYEQIQQVLLRCEKGGVSYVAQNSSRIIGFILSIQVPDLWIPEIRRIKELAWYVDNEFRNQQIGLELFQAYQRSAEQMRRQGQITGYTMSRLENSPKFDYERRGFRHIESTYMMGA
jgi:predicted N-acetyltransferase YhbS